MQINRTYDGVSRLFSVPHMADTNTLSVTLNGAQAYITVSGNTFTINGLPDVGDVIGISFDTREFTLCAPSDCPVCPDVPECPTLPVSTHPYLPQDVFDDLLTGIGLGGACLMADGVHVVGAAYNNVASNRHHVYVSDVNSANYGRYTNAANLPANRAHHRIVAATPDIAYIVGGVSGGGFIRYNRAPNTYTTLATMPAVLSAPKVAITGTGKVFVSGSFGGASRTTYLYNPSTNVWTTADDYPIWHGFGSAVGLSDGRVLCISGATTSDVGVTNCYFFDETAAPGSQYTAAPSIYALRGVAGVVDNKVYLHTGGYTISVLDLDAAVLGWNTLGKLPSRIANAEQGCVVDNPPRMITIGGYANESGWLQTGRASAIHLTSAITPLE